MTSQRRPRSPDLHGLSTDRHSPQSNVHESVARGVTCLTSTVVRTRRSRRRGRAPHRDRDVPTPSGGLHRPSAQDHRVPRVRDAAWLQPAIAIAGPSGEWLEGGDQATGGVVKFGPINPVNGFPDWYRDSNGIEVEPCLSNFDPNCNAPTPSPDPNSEASFPDNFPDEFFYFIGEAGADRQRRQRRPRALHDRGHLRRVGNTARWCSPVPATASAAASCPEPSTRSPTRTASTRSSRAMTQRSSSPTTSAWPPGELRLAVRRPGRPAALTWDADTPAGYLGDPPWPAYGRGQPVRHELREGRGPGVGGPATRTLPRPYRDHVAGLHLHRAVQHHRQGVDARWRRGRPGDVLARRRGRREAADRRPRRVEGQQGHRGP